MSSAASKSGSRSVSADAATTASKHLAAWSGLFKKTMIQRQEMLISSQFGESKAESDAALRAALQSGGLELAVADNMVENCIGLLGMPLGVAPTFVLNGEHYVVPMVTEEPSVIGTVVCRVDITIAERRACQLLLRERPS